MGEQLKVEMAQRASLFRLLVRRFGREVLDVVSQHTVDQTRHRLEDAVLDHRDLNAVMALLWDQMVEETEFVVEERTDTCIRLRVTKCLFAEEMTKLGATDIGEAFYCDYDFGFCQGLNPDIEFTRTKSLMTGDECCNHCYKLFDK